MRRLALALTVTFAACSHTPRELPTVRPLPASPRPEVVVVNHPTIAGFWRETWGIEGQTDVSYHDEYRIWFEDGEPRLEPLSHQHPDEVTSVVVRGSDVDIDLRTSFAIHYHLTLSADGSVLRGTATTPELTETIRWERLEHPTPFDPDADDETDLPDAP